LSLSEIQFICVQGSIDSADFYVPISYSLDELYSTQLWNRVEAEPLNREAEKFSQVSVKAAWK